MSSKRKMRKKPDEKVVVKSIAYSIHERTPKGTQSKTVLKLAMKAHAGVFGKVIFRPG